MLTEHGLWGMFMMMLGDENNEGCEGFSWGIVKCVFIVSMLRNVVSYSMGMDDCFIMLDIYYGTLSGPRYRQVATTS